MIARLAHARRRDGREAGFTLAELLSVTVIIGIIVSVAIPQFLAQQNRAYRSVARADARAVSGLLQAALLDVTNFGTGGAQLSISGNNLVITPGAGGSPNNLQVPVRLSVGSSLDMSSPSNNVATSVNNYCIALSNNGRVAFQGPAGAMSSCEADATIIVSGAASGGAGIAFYASVPTFLSASGLSSANWSKAAFGASGWVTVASGSTAAAVSANGTSWTTNTGLPASQLWSSIAYGNGVYVAVSKTSGTAYATSTNGSTWTARTSLPSGVYSEVLYAGGKFVAVGTNIVATSTDGLTWSAGTIPAGTWGGVTYGNGVYVAVQSVSSSTAASSTDGATWTARTLPSAQTWTDVAYGNGNFIAVSSTSSAASPISADGVTWSTTALPTGVNYAAINYTNGVWVTVASGTATAYTSTDSASWSTRTMPSSATWSGLAALNGVWILTSSGSSTVLVGV